MTLDATVTVIQVTDLRPKVSELWSSMKQPANITANVVAITPLKFQSTPKSTLSINNNYQYKIQT
jgi:hypothetical protein